MLSQEDGFNKMKIELPSEACCGETALEMALSDFEEAIDHVKKRLWELRKDEK